MENSLKPVIANVQNQPMRMKLDGIFHDKVETGLYGDKAFYILEKLSEQPVVELSLKTPNGLERVELHKSLFGFSYMGPVWTIDERGQICFYGTLLGNPDKRTLQPAKLSEGAKEEALKLMLKHFGIVLEALETLLKEHGLGSSTSIQIDLDEGEPHSIIFVLSDLLKLSELIQKRGMLSDAQQRDSSCRELAGAPLNQIEVEKNHVIKMELIKLHQKHIEMVSDATTEFFDRFTTAKQMNEHDEEYQDILQEVLEKCSLELYEFCEKWFEGKKSIYEYVNHCITNLRYI